VDAMTISPVRYSRATPGFLRSPSSNSFIGPPSLVVPVELE
jgi:hypothetical protein